jgi:hypothetical protein
MDFKAFKGVGRRFSIFDAATPGLRSKISCSFASKQDIVFPDKNHLILNDKMTELTE